MRGEGCSQRAAVLKAALSGARHPVAEVAEITFNFWYVLSEELAGGGRMLPDARREPMRALFARGGPPYI